MNSSRRFKFKRTIGFLFLLGVCALLMTARVAFAQDSESSAGASGGSSAGASGSSSAPAGGSSSGAAGSAANGGAVQKSNVKNGTKRTEINFEDQLIEGNGTKPGIFFFMQQKGNSFKKLIKLRENFLPEMRRTSDEVARKGSGN